MKLRCCLPRSEIIRKSDQFSAITREPPIWFDAGKKIGNRESKKFNILESSYTLGVFWNSLVW